MDDVNRWHNGATHQCSSEATKDWRNKLIAIGIFLCLEKCTIFPVSVVHRQEKTFCNSIIQMIGISRIYPPRNKQIAQILLESPIFSIFQRNNFGNKGEKHYFCK